MLSIGLRPNCLGYKYIFDLASMRVSGQEILPLKLNGYVTIAQKYGKSANGIDKNIQNCISKAWLDADIEALYNEFGNTIDMSKGKPTAKQLIMHICDKVTAVPPNARRRNPKHATT